MTLLGSRFCGMSTSRVLMLVVVVSAAIAWPAPVYGSPPSPSPHSPPPACGPSAHLTQDGSPYPGGSFSGPMRASDNGWEVGSATLYIDSPAPGLLSLALGIALPAGTVIQYNVFDAFEYANAVLTTPVPDLSGPSCHAPHESSLLSTVVPADTDAYNLTLSYAQLHLRTCQTTAFFPVVRVAVPAGVEAWLAWGWVAPNDPTNDICADSPTGWGVGRFSLYSCPCASPPAPPPAIIRDSPKPLPVPSPVPTGSLGSGFPFCSCTRRKPSLSPWRMTPFSGPLELVAPASPEGPQLATWCVDVAAAAEPVPAAGRCAGMDLWKIEFLIDPDCVAESPKAIRKTTVNGGVVFPTYSTKTWKGAKHGVLGLTRLGLTPDSGPIKLCFAMDVASRCSTPAALCTGSGCTYAFFNQKLNCCPTSSVAAGVPP